MGPERAQFASWLNATMRTRGLTQAEMARVVGVADAQVSRWRRGQVVPSVFYLQKIADTLDVPRSTLDRLAGYPVSQASLATQAGVDPEQEAELQTYQADFRHLLERRVPRQLWKAYAEACEALADSLADSFEQAVQKVQDGASGTPRPPRRAIGFQP